MRRHALAALLATATALYKVDIHIAGRAPSPKSWEAAAVDEYAKRLRGQIDVKTTWHKSGDQLEKSIAKMDSVICLSPEGKRVDSEGFSKLLYDSLDKGGSRLCLCIGPAEGFTDELRGRASLLSLSDLTLPHQLARVVLAEQIYIQGAAPFRESTPSGSRDATGSSSSSELELSDE